MNELAIVKRKNELNKMDRNAVLWVQNNMRTPKTTRFFTAVTRLGDKGILWMGLSLLFMLPKKTREIGKLSFQSIITCFFVNNVVMKNVFSRKRPYDVIDEAENIIEKQPDYSFPSGHAANSVASAVVFYRYCDNIFGKGALFTSLMIALSRLYVGVHYLSDVVVGVLVGTFTGVSVCKMSEKQKK